jgi:kynureninase
MHDMAAVTAAAHAAGALTVWDLAHSAGAVPVDLLARRRLRRGLRLQVPQRRPGRAGLRVGHPRMPTASGSRWPAGWGHAAPFEFTPDYRPAPGITRYLCGTPPVLSMAALECGVDTLLAAQPLGGMAALRAKSLALTDCSLRWSSALRGHGLGLATPREHANAAQVCLTRGTEGAYAIVQALIARGVIGDFRAGDGGQHPTSCASASRRCTSASRTCGTPWSTCARCWTRRVAARPNSTRTCGDLMGCPAPPPRRHPCLPEAMSIDEKAKLDFSPT